MMQHYSNEENESVMKQATTPHRIPTWCLVLFVISLAAIVRIYSASNVFPAQGDASHFIQYGIASYYNGIEGLSGYWSMAPQFLAAGAHCLGISPAYVLQASTGLGGILLVGGVFGLALSLTKSRRIAVFASLLTASTPILVASSTAGLSETPHMALSFCGLALCFYALNKRRWYYFALGSLCLALDLYYRPYDLFIICLAAAPFIGWKLFSLPRATMIKFILLGCIVFVVTGIPFAKITAMKKTGSVSSSKLVNIAYARYGLDAKVMWGTKGIDADDNPLQQEIDTLRDVGSLKYIWQNRTRIVTNYVSNILKSIRHLNAHAFTGSFRMGAFWFVLIGALSVVAALRSGMIWQTVYLCSSIALFPLLLSIGFIHPRWIMQCVPFYFILVSMGVAAAIQKVSSKSTRTVFASIFVAAIVLNFRWAAASSNDQWRGLNIAPVAHKLRSYLSEDDRIMCFGPMLPISFYRTNSLAYMEIPYGEVDRIATWADQQSMDAIVIHNASFPHFPIHEITSDPSKVPTNWQEIDRIIFEKETRFGLENDQYVVYRRIDSSSTR
jgi:hypothetical protein